MGIAINYNFHNYTDTNKTVSPVNLNNSIAINPKDNIIRKTIVANNSSSVHITFNKTIEYNIMNSYIERKVIDMNAEIQTEINKLIKNYRNAHIVLFVISVTIAVLSWTSTILTNDTSIVLKPLSLAFSLMILINYYLRRIK